MSTNKERDLSSDLRFAVIKGPFEKRVEAIRILQTTVAGSRKQ